jgi:hypothetical protein
LPINLSWWHPTLLIHPACLYHPDKRSWCRLHTIPSSLYTFKLEGPLLRCDMLRWTHYNVLVHVYRPFRRRVG